MLLWFAVEVALNIGRFDVISCLASVQERWSSLLQTVSYCSSVFLTGQSIATFECS